MIKLTKTGLRLTFIRVAVHFITPQTSNEASSLSVTSVFWLQKKQDWVLWNIQLIVFTSTYRKLPRRGEYFKFATPYSILSQICYDFSILWLREKVTHMVWTLNSTVLYLKSACEESLHRINRTFFTKSEDLLFLSAF